MMNNAIDDLNARIWKARQDFQHAERLKCDEDMKLALKRIQELHQELTKKLQERAEKVLK